MAKADTVDSMLVNRVVAAAAGSDAGAEPAGLGRLKVVCKLSNAM